VWHLQKRLLVRDAPLWTRQSLVESGFALLAVLAAVNRVWFTSFQFKRQREFAAQLPIAPVDLADRLEALTRAETGVAIEVLESLVAETQSILAVQLPQFDSTLRRGPGTRETPWRLPASSA